VKSVVISGGAPLDHPKLGHDQSHDHGRDFDDWSSVVMTMVNDSHNTVSMTVHDRA
jgi:hypothetical protein